ncbi:cytochrome c oxidase subunit VIII [Schizosaccharomyces cryophilus OY26]|uniref:Cytochrome c oxidase subunit 8, mitochondrial n=1 Tax=Schizosaccharomyces cryophilus (strain OY26 / ATCC MYA-4695 / CBS 11777 / NBRC 106824 / NRRL Y48691) TaxID=653667 RepID=S9W697_SCHCR|nr:cytochrome c oxidase subunit VIII [Schizosaccharomyces cryophilus OY26]EPY53330.1 cytochrome c oxidase subunit VIII [Schizosaccharomyces cryophilus OY26]
MLLSRIAARSALRGVRFSSSHAPPKPGSTVPFYVSKKAIPTMLFIGSFGAVLALPVLVVKYHNRNAA